MIHYNPGRFGFRLIWRIQGSVFPRATVIALFPTFVTILIKVLTEYMPQKVQDELYSLEQMRQMYQTLTWVLGFVLVFRTQSAYSRYWDGANHLMKMTTEWCDACGQVLTFSDTSNCEKEQIQSFQTAVTRLFSLMHGLALQEIAIMEDECFECLDLTGIDPQMLEGLQELTEPGEKCEVVFQWIERMVCEGMINGLIPTPPPVVSRVFNEMNNGMIAFRSMVLISEVPFPFPYAQVVSLLLAIQFMMTPFLVGTVDAHLLVVALFSFVSTCSLVVIALTSQEIELPFGDDPNDLDCARAQRMCNLNLLRLNSDLARSKPAYQVPLGIPQAATLDAVKSRDCPMPPKPEIITNMDKSVTTEVASGYARRVTTATQKSDRITSLRKERADSKKTKKTVATLLEEKRRTQATRISLARREVQFVPGPPPAIRPSPTQSTGLIRSGTQLLQHVDATIEEQFEKQRSNQIDKVNNQFDKVADALSHLVHLQELTLESTQHSASAINGQKRYSTVSNLDSNLSDSKAGSANETFVRFQIPESDTTGGVRARMDNHIVEPRLDSQSSIREANQMQGNKGGARWL